MRKEKWNKIEKKKKKNRTGNKEIGKKIIE